MVNLGGRPVAIVSQPRPIQTERLNAVSYLVPSILGMALMQTGIFAAIPLVADRQKLILKRLAATPAPALAADRLERDHAAAHRAGPVRPDRRASGSLAFDVQIVGSLIAIAALAILGSLAFTSLGYVIATLAKTEDAANGMTSAVQFPMMFLSGTFFPIALMPDAAPDGRPVPAPDLPVRRPPPGHGRRRGLCPAVGLRRGPRRLDGGLLRLRRAPLPVAVARPAEPAYQRSSWTISASGRRPPGRSGARERRRDRPDSRTTGCTRTSGRPGSRGWPGERSCS